MLSRKEVLNWFGGLDEYIDFHIENTTGLMEEWEGR